MESAQGGGPRRPRIEVWAPLAEQVEIEWTPVAGSTNGSHEGHLAGSTSTNWSKLPQLQREPMTPVGDGWWGWDGPGPALASGTASGLGGGTGSGEPGGPASGMTLDYAFVLDGAEPALPDPRSAWQPHGVHGPSRTFDPTAFTWTDDEWRGPRSGAGVLGSVVYELHLGTFTPEGTLDAAATRLDHLVDLGVDVVELMPVAAFPGRWGWGYDGVDLWAVHDGYGGPAALQRFVDGCHARGLGVALDVVHNHLGASGNYLARVRPLLHPGAPHPVGPVGQPRPRGLRTGAPVPARELAALVPRLPRRRAAARRRARAQGRLAAALPRRAVRRRGGARHDARPTARPGRRERPQRHRDGHSHRAGRPRHDGAVGRRRAPRAARGPHGRGARLLRRLLRRRRPRRGRTARRPRQGAHPRLPPRRQPVDLPRPPLGQPGRRRAARRPPAPGLPADARPGRQPDGGGPRLGRPRARPARPLGRRSTSSARPRR